MLPIPEKQWIADFANDSDVFSWFLLAAAKSQRDRNGRLYWTLELRDKTGSLGGKIWSPLSETDLHLQAGSVVKVAGKIVTYMDALQLNVNKIRPFDNEELAEADLSALQAASVRPPKEMLAEIEALCRRELSYQPWQDFVLTVLADSDIRHRLLIAPAAQKIHHAWIGGLLEHSLSVARICLALCDLYPQLDRQILLVAAVLHDIGKIWEISGQLGNNYTDEGNLIGHITLGLEKLAPYLENSSIDPELAMHFRHLVLSHHGLYEYGSPCLPKTAEALTLHYADNLDAKLVQIQNLFKNQGDAAWTQYQPTMQRAIFRAAQTPAKQPAAVPEAEMALFPDAAEPRESQTTIGRYNRHE